MALSVTSRPDDPLDVECDEYLLAKLASVVPECCMGCAFFRKESTKSHHYETDDFRYRLRSYCDYRRKCEFVPDKRQAKLHAGYTIEHEIGSYEIGNGRTRMIQNGDEIIQPPELPQETPVKGWGDWA